MDDATLIDAEKAGREWGRKHKALEIPSDDPASAHAAKTESFDQDAYEAAIEFVKQLPGEDALSNPEMQTQAKALCLVFTEAAVATRNEDLDVGGEA